MPEVDYDFSSAVQYHYEQFPPSELDFSQIITNATEAAASLAKYDALLKTLHSSNLLLAPLRHREAVISSRIEGTVATLDEVLRYEAQESGSADERQTRQEVLEVFSYNRSMNHAQRLMSEGLPLSGRLMRETHSRLLLFGRGAEKKPGEFKTEQNYIVDRTNKKVLFIPVSPEKFSDQFLLLEQYMNDDSVNALIQTAVSHAEFESLHPFRDGNGRLGRMLITLMLWSRGLISAPHFYVSDSIEKARDEYIDRLREVSSHGRWTEWCNFFFEVLVKQAEENIAIVEKIRQLYEEMKDTFREITGSQWSISALDFIFSKPIFKNSVFVSSSGIPKVTAHRITRVLHESGLLTLYDPASGRRSALYAFEPLLGIARA